MPRIRAICAASAIGFGLCATIADAGEIWRNDWFLSAPPTLALMYSNTPLSSFAANGDVVLATMSYSQVEYQFVRFGADGTLRWSANANWSLTTVSGLHGLIAAADGGALIAFGDENNGDPEYIARVDASGAFAWMRQIPSQVIAEVGTDRIIAIGCGNVLTLLDRVSGDVIWQQVDAGLASCGTGGIAADGAGNIYTLAEQANAFRTLKHDATGTLAWNVDSDAQDGSTVSIVGVSDGLLYVRALDQLHALHTGDGSEAWSANIGSPTALLLAGSPAEAIVVTSSSVSRLAEDTGIARWTTPLANNSSGVVAPLGDSLLVATSSHALARVTLADGGIAWNATLPGLDASGHSLNYFAFGGLDNGNFSAVAAPITRAPVPAFIESVAFASAAPNGAVDVPAVAQGPRGISNTNGAGRVLQVQSAWNSLVPTARVRSLDETTGLEQWTQSAPLDLDIFGSDTPDRIVTDVGSTPTSTIVAASVSERFSSSASLGALWLGLYDSASGNPLWQSVIRDNDQGTTNASTPMIDAQGDIYVDVGASVACGDTTCGRQTLRKISRADGHVIWHFATDTADGGDLTYPQTFAIAGADAVVAGPFSGALSSQSVISLAGSDGSTQWTSNVLGAGAVAELFPASDAIFAVGSGWAKLDRVTGNVLWQGPEFAAPCTPVCARYDSTLLPNGDIVEVGENGSQSFVTMLRGDGSGTYANWQLLPNDPSIRSAATSVVSDASGRVWVGLLRQAKRSGTGLFALVEIDPATGAMLSQQALRARQVDPLQANTLLAFQGPPVSNRLLLDERTVAPPAPTPNGNVMLDTTITAHGDLVATVDVDHAIAHPQQTIGFHARMTYTGDAPIAGAHLNVYLPWASGPHDAVCSGGNGCTIDTKGGNVLATVDLAPGDVVDISGNVLVLYKRFAEAATVGALAIGPVGLSETDTLNNIAQCTVSEGIFANGFDGG